MDLRNLKKRMDLVEESGIAELEITEGEQRVRIARATPPSQPMYMMAPPGAPIATSPALTIEATPEAPEGHVVRSPMVGTFYRSPSPGSKDFFEHEFLLRVS